MSATFLGNRGTSSQNPVGVSTITYNLSAPIAAGSKAILFVESDNIVLNSFTVGGVAGTIDGSFQTVAGNIARVYMCSIDVTSLIPAGSVVSCVFAANVARFNSSIDEYSGLALGGPANVKTATGTSQTWDTGTPTLAAQVGDLVVAGFSHDAGSIMTGANWTAGAGFTKQQTLGTGASVIRNLMTEYQVAASNSSKNGTGTTTSLSAAWGAIAGLYSQLAATGGGPPYTLSLLRSALQDHGFADMATARQNELLNDAYLDICSREPWPFLFQRTDVAISSDTELVALPANLSQITSVVIEADGWPGHALEPMRPETAEKQFAAEDLTHDVPQYYWVQSPNSAGNTAGGLPMYLKVWPMTDTAYTLTVSYIAVPQPLSADSDLPIIPTTYQRLILMGALVSAYHLEDEIQMSSRQEQLYEKRLAMMRDELLWQTDRPQVVIDLYTDEPVGW